MMTVATHDRRGEPSPRARLLEPESTGLKSQAPLRARSELKNPMAGTYSVKEDQRRVRFRITLATAKRMWRSTDLRYPATRPTGEDPHARKNDPIHQCQMFAAISDHILAIRGSTIPSPSKSSLKHDSRRIRSPFGSSSLLTLRRIAALSSR